MGNLFLFEAHPHEWYPSWDFPWNKPSSFGFNPMAMETPSCSSLDASEYTTQALNDSARARKDLKTCVWQHSWARDVKLMMWRFVWLLIYG